MALQTMIIIGEITGFDIGKDDLLIHMQDEHGVWHRCLGDANNYGPAVRLLAKNKDRIKITGEIALRVVYTHPNLLQPVFVISFLEQLHEASEDFNFRLTGALY